MAALKLWLLRHAEVLCAPGLCYGASDLAANEARSLQAAQAIAPHLPQGLALRSSPLVRCVSLAEALVRLRPDLGPVTLDARLAEMDFGRWEGRPWQAIDRSEFDAWLADFAHARPGGGESTFELMRRIHAAWQDLLRTRESALWVTHAGVMRAMQLIAQGRHSIGDASEWPSEAIAMGSWQVIDQPALRGEDLGGGVLGL